MHVGLVIRRLIGRNGEELGTAELADELTRRGVRVTILSAGPAEPPPGSRYEVVDLGVGRLDRSSAWKMLEEAVGRQVEPRGIELVHSMGPLVACDLHQPRGGAVAETYARYLAMPRGLLGRWRARFRVAWSRSIRARLRREREFFDRRPLPVIIAISHYVARQLWHHHGLGPERVRTVFGAVEHPRFEPRQKAEWRRRLRESLSVGERTTLLLFVAQQFEQKGLGYLIDALGRAERQAGRPSPAGSPPTWALAVIGRDAPSRYRRQAERLRLACPVHFLGAMEREAVWGYYAAADVLVLPTVFDACSRTVLEALAMGTPAITTEHNGAGELIDQRGAGREIHSAWAIDELADSLVAAANPATRQSWASAAEQLADYVSVRRMADELMPIYEQVLSARRK